MVNNLVGKKFGKLTVISRAENTKDGKARWLCKCDCGKIKSKSVTTYDLQSGKVKSCGCLYYVSNKGRNKTHGLTNSRLHRIWSGIHSRCFYKGNFSFEHYGGRGITVCQEWTNFNSFYDWAMANGYAENLTIDRIDVNGNYEPSNCRWVDMKTQQNNRSNNRKVDYCGIKLTVSELSTILSIPYATLLNRINSGWGESELAMKPNLNNKNIRRATT